MTKAPALTPEQRQALTTTLRRWADAHPSPDVPIFNSFTPRMMADGLDEDNEVGRLVERLVACSINPVTPEDHDFISLDKVLATYDADSARWELAKQSQHTGLGIE